MSPNAVREQLNKIQTERNAAIAERNDLQASADLRWKADMRAIKMWQEAHPGNDLVWPDHADLCVWLLEQLTKRRGALLRIREALGIAILGAAGRPINWNDEITAIDVALFRCKL